MPVVSMTGYGCGTAIYKGLRIDAEITSVNKKQFEAIISLPHELGRLEPLVLEMIQREISRGHINCSITLKMSPEGYKRYTKLDIERACIYVDLLRKAARKLNIQDDINISTLLNIPRIVKNTEVDIDIKTIWQPVREAVSQALAELIRKRKQEGKKIEKYLTVRLKTMMRLLNSIRKRIPVLRTREQRKLKKILFESEMLYRRAGGGEITEKKVEEILIPKIVSYLGASTVDEEISRIEMHLNSALKLLNRNKPPGRDLDFIAVEIMREINTLGAKLKDYRISSLIIRFKLTLESFREQVQNIE